MKKQRGFSLLEVMIAAALMMVIALGVWQLMATTTKSAGDIEKRLRYRDLVEDIRFQFLLPALCSASIPGGFQEDGEIRLAFSRDNVVAKDSLLPEYGLKVTRFYVKNVQRLPENTRTLVMPDGQYLGQYRETGEVADIFLEAQILGSNHPLKPMNVVRVAKIRRVGSVNEDLCVASHDVPGRGAGSLASVGDSGPGGTTDPGFSFDPPPANPITGANPAGKPPNGGTYKSAEECWIKDEEVKKATGRVRLIEGETLKFSRFPGMVTYLKCIYGQLEETTKAQ